MRAFLLAIVIVFLVFASGAGAGPSRDVLCGPGCGGGDGRPACQDWNLGAVWTASNGTRWVCVWGYPDYWKQI